MPSQIIFFRKNWADFEKSTVVVTATEASSLAPNVIARSNRTLWGTSGSTDASNTQLTVDAGDIGTIDSVLLLKHNFKNYLLEYYDPIALTWTTLISVTGYTDKSSYHTFPTVQTQKIRLTITGTQIANSDKVLSQFIMTSTLGKLNGWPVMAKPLLARNIVEQKMLSGKSSVIQNVGFFAVSLMVSNWSDPTDLATVEALYNNNEGFLYWPCGGDETQFRSVRQGYRKEDIFLCRCKNEFSPEWAYGLYKSGMKLQIDLIEVVT